MSARIIDGKAVAARLRARLAERVATLPFAPGLAVLLVGDDPASAIYVRAKDRAAKAAGIATQTIRLPAGTSEAALLARIAALNADASVDGILVQLPLPPDIGAPAMIEAVDPDKDVDGFHPLNAGRLAGGRPGLVPCTPLGVMKLLAEADVALAGARALVLGRSAIVGRPMAALLMAPTPRSQSRIPARATWPANAGAPSVLVAAIGRPEMVRGDWIAAGAVVIDVGINRLADGRLAGDVAFDEARAVAAAITPVPGGVGPMTIACLLENTVTAALRRRGTPSDQKSVQRPLTSQSP